MHETREFMPAVIELAELLGWRVYHQGGDIRKGVRSATGPGFPDLVMVRTGELLFVELKSETGYVSDAQVAWLQALAEVVDSESDSGYGSGGTGIAVHVWRPAQWLDGTIERALR